MILPREKFAGLSEARSSQNEVNLLKCKVKDREAQALQGTLAPKDRRSTAGATPTAEGMTIGEQPLMEAPLFLTGLMRGHDVHTDLCGVTPLATNEEDGSAEGSKLPASRLVAG